MAEPSAAPWTVARLEALPYDEWHRYEIIDGELFVSTAPHFRHQVACTKSSRALDEWNDATRLGVVAVAPGLIFSEIDAVIPDVVWISHERIARLADAAGHFQGAPELVVEVLSPGAKNRRRDLDRKLRLYSRYGVDEYWIVDWRAETVAVYRRAVEEKQGMVALRLVATLARDEIPASPLLPGFSLSVAHLFMPR
jgi:Uma2 family endonuclease